MIKVSLQPCAIVYPGLFAECRPDLNALGARVPDSRVWGNNYYKVKYLQFCCKINELFKWFLSYFAAVLLAFEWLSHRQLRCFQKALFIWKPPLFLEEQLALAWPEGPPAGEGIPGAGSGRGVGASHLFPSLAILGPGSPPSSAWPASSYRQAPGNPILCLQTSQADGDKDLSDRRIHQEDKSAQAQGLCSALPGSPTGSPGRSRAAGVSSDWTEREEKGTSQFCAILPSNVLVH